MIIDDKKIVSALWWYSASALLVSLLEKHVSSCHFILTYSLTSALKSVCLEAKPENCQWSLSEAEGCDREM